MTFLRRTLAAALVCVATAGITACGPSDPASPSTSPTPTPFPSQVTVSASMAYDVFSPAQLGAHTTDIAIATIIKLGEASNYDPQRDVHTRIFTTGTMTIVKVYKGGLKPGTDITFLKMGGTIPFSKYREGMSEKAQEALVEPNPETVTETWKEDQGLTPQEGKTYLVYLRHYEMKGVVYAINGFAGGMREVRGEGGDTYSAYNAKTAVWEPITAALPKRR